MGKQYTSLDYGEEVHGSRILRGWSNRIGYKMGSLLVGVYTMAKISLVENFERGWKNDMANQHGNILLGELSGGSSFLGNFKPSYKKLEGFVYLFFRF